MATKLQYAINPLATSSNNSFLVNQVSDCGYSLEIGPRKNLGNTVLNLFNHSVDEMFGSHNIESIKKTMLMQEDIFKQQVKELHRLYELQMKLMCELKNEMTQNQSATSIKATNNSEFSNWHQPIRDIKSDLPIYRLRDDPREPIASCSGESPRMLKGLNLEKMDEERSSTSVLWIEQDQKGLNSNSSRLVRTNDTPDDEIDVELKLSIGCSSSRKGLNNCTKELGSSDSNYNGGEHSSSSSSLMKKEKAKDKGDPGHAVSSSSAILNQNIARSNWIFQDLSLNRT